MTTLKRVADVIFSKGGFIRQIDNLGLQPMPFRTKAHDIVHREAKYAADTTDFIAQFSII